jgi:hypothetical protein
VARWNLKSASLCILLCMFLLMLLIVVLPDVDLPDTAFRRDTAPLVAHTQATSAPAALSISIPVAFLTIAESFHVLHRELAFGHFAPPNFLPVLFRSIRR